MSKPAEYVVYQGDEVVAVGTAQECAKTLGITVDSLRCAATPSKIAIADSKENSRQYVAIRV